MKANILKLKDNLVRLATPAGLEPATCRLEGGLRAFNINNLDENVASLSRLSQQCLFRRLELRPVVTAREKVAIRVERHRNRRVSQPALSRLRGQT
jgi:hypothetical protein